MLVDQQGKIIERLEILGDHNKRLTRLEDKVFK